MREADIQNLIRIELSKHAIVFRANVGKVRMADGRFFDTGLPKGFTDLFGFRKSDGKLFFLEIKTETGRVREVQEHFIQQMGQYDVITGIARSVDEALAIVLESE